MFNRVFLSPFSNLHYHLIQVLLRSPGGEAEQGPLLEVAGRESALAPSHTSRGTVTMPRAQGTAGHLAQRSCAASAAAPVSRTSNTFSLAGAFHTVLGHQGRFHPSGWKSRRFPSDSPPILEATCALLGQHGMS